MAYNGLKWCRERGRGGVSVFLYFDGRDICPKVNYFQSICLQLWLRLLRTASTIRRCLLVWGMISEPKWVSNLKKPSLTLQCHAFIKKTTEVLKSLDNHLQNVKNVFISKSPIFLFRKLLKSSVFKIHFWEREREGEYRQLFHQLQRARRTCRSN